MSILKRNLKMHNPSAKPKAHTVWENDYSVVFEPNSKGLYGLHKVPKFKHRHLHSW